MGIQGCRNADYFYRSDDDDDYRILTQHLVAIIRDQQDLQRKHVLMKKLIDKAHYDKCLIMFSIGYTLDVFDQIEQQTALHYAWRNHNDMLMYDRGIAFFRADESNENRIDSNGLSYLHIACCLGNAFQVQKLLQIPGIDTEGRYFIGDNSYANTEGLTPLHCAILFHRQEIVRLLLPRVNPLAVDSTNKTCLHIASIISHYTSELSIRDDLDILKIFIERNSSQINSQDINGQTPLHLIYGNLSHDYMEITTQELREISKRKLDVVEYRGRQCEKLLLLLEKRPNMSIQNKNGDTVLHLLVSDLRGMRLPIHSSPICFEDFYHALALTEILEKSRDEVNVVNARGLTPVQLAISYMSRRLVHKFLESGVNFGLIEFARKDRITFVYPSITPTLECILHVIEIVDMLKKKNYQFTKIRLLSVLRFLVHTSQFCCCQDLAEKHVITMKLFTALSLSSANHVSWVSPVVGKKNIDEIKRYFRYIKYAQLYLPSQFEEVLRDKVNNYYDDVSAPLFQLRKEVRLMKETDIGENKTLYEIMKMDPHKIHQYIHNCNLQFLEEYNHYKDIIKGHIAKSLARNFLEECARTEFNLNDTLGNKIKEMSNEELLEELCGTVPELDQLQQRVYQLKSGEDIEFQEYP